MGSVFHGEPSSVLVDSRCALVAPVGWIYVEVSLVELAYIKCGKKAVQNDFVSIELLSLIY